METNDALFAIIREFINIMGNPLVKIFWCMFAAVSIFRFVHLYLKMLIYKGSYITEENEEETDHDNEEEIDYDNEEETDYDNEVTDLDNMVDKYDDYRG